MASFGFDLILQLFQNLGHVIGINNVVSVVCVSIPVVVEVAGTYLSFFFIVVLGFSIPLCERQGILMYNKPSNTTNVFISFRIHSYSFTVIQTRRYNPVSTSIAFPYSTTSRPVVTGRQLWVDSCGIYMVHLFMSFAIMAGFFWN